MASVFKRQGREGWYMKWTDGFGRARRKHLPARNKAEAERLATAEQHKVDRQREGYDPLPSDAGSLWELCSWWLREKCKARSKAVETLRLEKHIKSHPIGTMPVAKVTSETIERKLSEMGADGASPSTQNKIRTVLRTVFNRARKAKRWLGANPAEDVEHRTVHKKPHNTLSADEVPLALAAVAECERDQFEKYEKAVRLGKKMQPPHAWAGYVAVAAHLGLRKGELCGLQKADVNVTDWTMTVARSYDHASTKGNHTDVLPIATPLRPYITAAMASPGPWLFPAADGSMRSEHVDPQKILRTALKRAGQQGLMELARLEKLANPDPALLATARLKAGLLSGRFACVCRRCKGKVKREELPDTAEYCWTFSDDKPRDCPACGMKLTVSPVPRKMTFHDLRHGAGTMMLRAGVDPHRVQRILRHRDI